MMDLEFSLCINEGMTFSKLCDYLKKNTINSMLTFMSKAIIYNEISEKNDNASITINNVCEIDGSKVGSYVYQSTDQKYILCFPIDSLQKIIKNARKKDKIHIYKTRSENLIYVKTIRPNTSDEQSESISYLKPLDMQDVNIFQYPTSSRDENDPNCTVSPLIFKKDCSKISPKDYKEVTLVCHRNRIEIAVNSADSTDGHIIEYGHRNSFSNIVINPINLNIDLDNIYSSDNLMLSPVKVNVITSNDPMVIKMPTNAFKHLVKLSQLTDEPLRFFFEDDCIKILTFVSNYGVLRTYISKS